MRGRLRRAGRGATGTCRARGPLRRPLLLRSSLGPSAFKGPCGPPSLRGAAWPLRQPRPGPSRPGPTRPEAVAGLACLVWERRDIGQRAGPRGAAAGLRGPQGTGLGPSQSPCASPVRVQGSKDWSYSTPQGPGQVSSPCSSSPVRSPPPAPALEGRCHPSWLPTSPGDKLPRRNDLVPDFCPHSLQLGGYGHLSAMSHSSVCLGILVPALCAL